MENSAPARTNGDRQQRQFEETAANSKRWFGVVRPEFGFDQVGLPCAYAK